MNAPFEVTLWSTAEIGEYLGVAPKSVMERFGSHPDFPKAFKIPKADGGFTHPKWFAGDIVSWVKNNAIPY